MTEIYWHFAAETLRDGSPHPKVGAVLPRIKDIIPCQRGYHMSARPLDALRYAPGSYVAQVAPFGLTLEHGEPVDKLVAERRRQVSAYIDAGHVLREWSRWCALQVADLWDAPDVVRQYLETGNPELQDAARDAAWDEQNERLAAMLKTATA